MLCASAVCAFAVCLSVAHACVVCFNNLFCFHHSFVCFIVVVLFFIYFIFFVRDASVVGVLPSHAARA